MFVLCTLIALEHHQASSSTPLSAISEVEQAEKSDVHRATTDPPLTF